MIQLLPNELHIQILTYVITEANFEKFCTLRTVCKKWNAFIPLVMHQVVVSKLKSGLNFELTDCSYETVISENLLPTYCDSTKTFTFIFDQTEDINIFDILCFNKEKPDEYAIKLIALEVKVDEESNSTRYLRLYSFTIEAWKLYYILDCLDIESTPIDLRNGFQYSEDDDFTACFGSPPDI
ncbi:11307_t:CDS:2, partial [Dentiscutata erythropus]